MGKHKILYIVCIAVLSFHIRESQSRSLNDDELEHKIIEKTGNIEDSKRECFCFPKTKRGTPLLKFLPVNDEQERLVVYFYKNPNSNELTSFIPSWKKQSTFPELTYYDIGDKLETVAPDKIINLLDTTKVLDLEERTTVANPTVTDEQFYVNVKTEVPDLEILSVPPKVTNSNVVMEIAPENLAESVLLPATAIVDSNIIKDVNLNPGVNLSVGVQQQPVKSTSINHSEKPNEPSKNQNQQMLGTLDGWYTHIIPGKPRPKGYTTIGLNKYPSQLPIDQQNQNLNLPLEHHYKLIEGMPHVYNNLNVTLNESYDPAKLVHYYIPGYGDAVSPSKAHNMSYSGIYIESPNKESNITHPAFFPNKNQTFNEWYTEQMEILRSKRPLMFNALNVHLFKQHLMNALKENGIRLSKDGYFLYDSNGNILEMSNLKLRPVLFGESMDYKWANTRHCVIPYDLPYLEAILVTLIYSPRVLAIIPFGLDNVFFSTPQGKKAPLCSQFNCYTHDSYRLGLPEKENISSDVNDTVDTEDNDENSYTTEEKPGELIEEQPEYSNNIESKRDYTYVSTSMDQPVKLSAKPMKTRTGDQNSFHLILTPNDLGYRTHPIYYDKKNNFVSQEIPEYGIIDSYQSDLSEKEEPTILRRLFTAKTFNEDDFHTQETSNQIAEEVELLFTHDITSENDYSYMAANNDLLAPTFINDDYDGDTNEERLEVIDTNSVYYPNDIASNDDYLYVAFNNDLPVEIIPQNEEDASSDLLLTLTSRSNPGQSGPPTNNNNYYDNNIKNNNNYNINNNNLNNNNYHNRNAIDLDGRSALEEGKSLEDFYISQETLKQPDEEDYEILNIRIVGGNPATSSGTPVSSKGRSGWDF